MATNVYDAKAQATTLSTATRRGSHWTQRELDDLARMRAEGQTAQRAAAVLKRSLYGVRAIRNTEERRERATARQRTVLPYDRGFTTLEEMGF